MKKKHVYKTIELWEGSSEHWKQLWSIIDTVLENYDEIANKNDGLYLPYDFFNTLTQREKKQLLYLSN